MSAERGGPHQKDPALFGRTVPGLTEQSLIRAMGTDFIRQRGSWHRPLNDYLHQRSPLPTTNCEADLTSAAAPGRVGKSNAG